MNATLAEDLTTAYREAAEAVREEEDRTLREACREGAEGQAVWNALGALTVGHAALSIAARTLGIALLADPEEQTAVAASAVKQVRVRCEEAVRAAERAGRHLDGGAT